MQQALQTGRAERGSRVALSGAVATCIETEKAQYARNILFITCGIGFADAAAADQLLTLLGLSGSVSQARPLREPPNSNLLRGKARLGNCSLAPA